MTRQQMVDVFTVQLRRAYTRRHRIAMIHSVWGHQYQTADGVIDGIIQAAQAFGITFSEIEGGNSR